MFVALTHKCLMGEVSNTKLVLGRMLFTRLWRALRQVPSTIVLSKAPKNRFGGLGIRLDEFGFHDIAVVRAALDVPGLAFAVEQG